MDHADRKIIVANNGKQQAKTTKQQPRGILDEDEYTSTLSHIVTRDYFPSLHSLRRDAAILEARSRGDISGAVAVRRVARRDEMEREREWKEEMDAEQEAVAETTTLSLQPQKVQVRKRPRPLKHESITGFHARVTSEDNAEFEMNQERERKDREKILGVVYAARADKGGRLMIESCVNPNNGGEGSAASNNNARALLGCDTPIGLSSDLYDAPPSAGLRITDGDGTTDNGSRGIGRNGLFFQPQHLPAVGNNQSNRNSANLLLSSSSGVPSGGTFLSLENGNASETANANQSKSITNNTIEEGGNAKSDNLLMPPPPSRLPASSSVVPFQQSDSQSDSANSIAASSKPSVDNRCQLVEYLPKPSLPGIHPPATRFPYQNESRLLPNNNNGIVPANRRGMIRTGSYTDASDTTDLDASPPPLDLERAAHQKARLREHETYVAMTPLIRPGGSGNGGKSSFESDEPLMTWGDVASTPLVLGSGTAVDGNSTSVDWEPTRPASLSVDVDSGSSGPAFDVVDENNRETLARRAERGLMDRANTYRAAGSSGLSKRDKAKDDESIGSYRSTSTSATPLDRTTSLTPAARALLEASNNAIQSKKKSNSRSIHSSTSSRIFQTSSSTSRLSSNAAKVHAGSRDSFGSALRMSYSSSASRKEGTRKRKSSSSSSSMRRAAGGATPRCHSLR
ncbi:hypothetical protein ACHAXR_009135 [Thalassiosira sp. AJA248-18]